MGEYYETGLNLKKFKKWLQRHNSNILEPQAGDEVLRFSTRSTDGVIHKKGNGRYLPNKIAAKAINCFTQHQPWAGGIGCTAANHRKERTRYERLELIRFLADRDGGCVCAYCEETLTELSATIEHVIPVSKGGPDIPANMIIACQACNLKAGSLSPKAKMDLIRMHVKNTYFQMDN